MCERAPHLSLGSKICDRCRKKVNKLAPPEPPAVPDVSLLDPDYVPPASPTAISSINKCLVEIGETPFSKSKARGKKYSQQKIEKIADTMSRMAIGPQPSMNDGKEMIEQLKQKFETTEDKTIQLQILTVLPKSWPVRKIEQEFGVTTYFAQKAKKIVKEKGVLSLPGPTSWSLTAYRDT